MMFYLLLAWKAVKQTVTGDLWHLMTPLCWKMMVILRLVVMVILYINEIHLWSSIKEYCVVWIEHGDIYWSKLMCVFPNTMKATIVYTSKCVYINLIYWGRMTHLYVSNLSLPDYCQMNSWECTQWDMNNTKISHKKTDFKCCLQNGAHFITMAFVC